MKSCVFLAIIGISLFVACARADCGDAASQNPDDGEVKAWLKNLGCTIKKGAGDLSETAKPWAEKIGQGAKDLGSTVAQKYDDIKHKLTDDAPNTAAQSAVLYDEPTEKVPLAPLGGETPVPAAPGQPTPTA